MREEYYDQREALHAIKKTDDTRRSDELADLRAQVAALEEVIKSQQKRITDLEEVEACYHSILREGQQ